MPPGFTPTAGWQPDPSWPQAPAGWQYWIPDTSGGKTMMATPQPGLGAPPPVESTVSIPAPTPAAWGALGGAPGAATPSGFTPRSRPGSYSVQSTDSGSGLGVGISGLVLAILGIFGVVTMQGVYYALIHNYLTYSARFQLEENVLAWLSVACLLIATVLGAVGVRKPRGGAALAALIVCGVAAALCSVPVY